MDISKKIEHRFKESNSALYASHEKVHSREVKGIFQTLRKFMVFVLLGVYYGTAWLTWDGRQAVLFDLPERQFHIFFLTFWPQDFFFLAWLLVMAALALFFFTALAGRLWCGYACPQTVWTEIFVWMERWVEGDRSAQKKLAAMPWNWEKIRKRSLKQILWVSFSLWTGFTLVGYFTPIRELGPMVLSTFEGVYLLGPWETFWILFYALATYGFAGFLREQVCLYMCPYARFQSAMFDQSTLIISYDADRGEPRAKGKKRREKEAQVGDCVDCSLCVQVCPTGIDIRDGLQYECIACAACIDVCNQVMDKTGSDRNLIKYTSEDAMTGKATSIFRPRILIYAALLGTLFLAFVYAIANRTPIAADIIRDRGTLYRVINEYEIENSYNFKVMNKSEQALRVSISLPDVPNAVVNSIQDRPIASGDVGNIPVTVKLPVSDTSLSIKQLEFLIAAEVGGKRIEIREQSSFIAPR